MNQRGLHFQVIPRPLSDMIRTSLPPVTIGSNALQQHADNWSTRPGEGIVQQELISRHKAAIFEQLRTKPKAFGAAAPFVKRRRRAKGPTSHQGRGCLDRP